LPTITNRQCWPLTRGGGAFCRWVDGLDAASFGELVHLREYGWTQQPAEVAKQLAAAGNPDNDSLTPLIQSLAAACKDTEVLAITDATSPDKPDRLSASQADAELRQMVRDLAKKKFPDVRLSATHAPKGGVTIAGKQFTGGQFIPAEDLAKATPQEKAKIEAHSPSAADRTYAHRQRQKVYATYPHLHYQELSLEELAHDNEPADQAALLAIQMVRENERADQDVAVTVNKHGTLTVWVGTETRVPFGAGATSFVRQSG
jgi:hypothetical protein